MGRLPDASWLDRDPATGVAMVVGRHRLASDVVGELIDDLTVSDVRIVVCDLGEMAVSPRTMSQVFAPVESYLAGWPGTLVVVCVPDPAQYSRILSTPIAEHLLVHRSIEGGVREARKRTAPLEQASTSLAPVREAAAGGRGFVTHALEDWQLPDLAWPASLVTSELVTNSVLHSVTIVDLTVSHACTRVRITVHDHGGGVPAMPSSTEAEAATQLNGRGLQIINAVTSAWGVFPTRPCGKTVWALLDAA
jgi:anti-sigma regulatory factor (Ser/Thr protein kinase)